MSTGPIKKRCESEREEDAVVVQEEPGGSFTSGYDIETWMASTKRDT